MTEKDRAHPFYIENKTHSTLGFPCTWRNNGMGGLVKK